MLSDIKSLCQRYSLAISCLIAAAWSRQLLSHLLDDRVPFGTYLLAVLFTAWLAGTGPATLTLLLGMLCALHLHIPPENSLIVDRPGDLLALFIYGIVGATAITLFHRESRQHEFTQQQLNRIELLSAKLQEADRRKDEFLALLAHELRNPLAAVRSGLVLLSKPKTEFRETTNVLPAICRQLEQLVRIVDDLVDVSRFVHGQIQLQLLPTDLNEVVNAAVEQTRHLFRARHHRLQLLLPDHTLIVEGDRVRLIQLVSNLLTNASKYTPDAGLIQIILDQSGNEASLRISDNGIGIPAGDQLQIFELFARTEAAVCRDQGGLGLGLPFARELAHQHQGQLSVHSDGPGRGSCFVITLPLSPVQLEDCELPDQAGHSLSSGASAALPEEQTAENYRVLIIDDNLDASAMLAEILTYEGFEVETAADGVKGIIQAKKFVPDVILLDIGLPGIDGYEVARRLRAEVLFRERPIIALTGWDGEQAFSQSQAAGFSRHLVKPVDPGDLVQILRGRCKDDRSPLTETSL